MLDYYSNFNESKIKKELNLDVYQLSSQIKNPNREKILENIDALTNDFVKFFSSVIF